MNHSRRSFLTHDALTMFFAAIAVLAALYSVEHNGGNFGFGGKPSYWFLIITFSTISIVLVSLSLLPERILEILTSHRGWNFVWVIESGLVLYAAMFELIVGWIDSFETLPRNNTWESAFSYFLIFYGFGLLVVMAMVIPIIERWTAFTASKLRIQIAQVFLICFVIAFSIKNHYLSFLCISPLFFQYFAEQSLYKRLDPQSVGKKPKATLINVKIGLTPALWGLSIIISAFLGLFLSTWDINESESAQFLTTQAQVIAALLGLIASISFVAAQLSTRYANRGFTVALGFWLASYGIAYFIGIILPFSLLLLEPNAILVCSSYGIGILCILIIIPYFIDLRRRLSTDYIVSIAVHNALISYKKGLVEKSEENLNSLENVAIGSLQAGDYEILHLSVEGIGELLNAVYKDKERDSNLITRTIISSLRIIGSRGSNDLKAVDEVITVLSRAKFSEDTRHAVLEGLTITSETMGIFSNASPSVRSNFSHTMEFAMERIAETSIECGLVNTIAIDYLTNSAMKEPLLPSGQSHTMYFSLPVHSLLEMSYKAWMKESKGPNCAFIKAALEKIHRNNYQIIEGTSQMSLDTWRKVSDDRAKALEEFLVWANLRSPTVPTENGNQR